uniref:Uncharacterized protein n=1 Tax=Ditylenchus dipsaci TaxID=166011 RepID=A0A915E0U0_9BILA
MINEVKNAFELARMGKQDNILGSSMSEGVYEQHNELNSLTHVLEASTNSPKTEAEMSELIQIFGFGEHIWAKKVDDRHYLLVFPSPAKASEVLFSNSKRNNGQSKKVEEYSKAKPTGPRPQTTASVARRMIANSLNMRIDVSSQQRNKESNQLAAAKEQKLRKNAIWERTIKAITKYALDLDVIA